MSCCCFDTYDLYHLNHTILNFRYGFDVARCTEALEKCDGDLGCSLELLLSEAFDLPLSQQADASELGVWLF